MASSKMHVSRAIHRRKDPSLAHVSVSPGVQLSRTYLLYPLPREKDIVHVLTRKVYNLMVFNTVCSWKGTRFTTIQKMKLFQGAYVVRGTVLVHRHSHTHGVTHSPCPNASHIVLHFCITLLLITLGRNHRGRTRRFCRRGARPAQQGQLASAHA